ncbi:MAG TPA: hypothetical protein VLG46_05185, partial [Anaerolineae bacterium]|nr:hypothetical protein [Anaerolineae bacterium]
NGRPGYDGQFAYQIARDPLNGWTKIDVPAYRYQRIVYPIVARLLALGNVDLVPWTLIVVNLMALTAGVWLTEEILQHFQVSRWYALIYGLSAGTLMSVRLDLTEPLAYALAQAGVLLALKDRWRRATLVLAVAALTKEMTLAVAAGIGLVYLFHHQWRRSLVFGIGVLLPFVIWQIMLWQWLGQPGLGSGGDLATPFEIVPLRGLWSLAFLDWRIFLLLAAIAIPVAVIPALMSLWVAGRQLWRQVIDIPTMVLLLNALLVLFTPQSTFREPLALMRYSVGLIAAVLTYAASHRSQRALRYSWLWVFTLALALNEAQLPI